MSVGSCRCAPRSGPADERPRPAESGRGCGTKRAGWGGGVPSRSRPRMSTTACWGTRCWMTRGKQPPAVAGIKARPKRPRSGRVRHGGGWAHTAYEELPDVASSAVTGRFVISPSTARRLFAASRSALSASCAACGHANTTPVGQSIVLYCDHQFAAQKGKETQIMT